MDDLNGHNMDATRAIMNKLWDIMVSASEMAKVSECWIFAM